MKKNQFLLASAGSGKTTYLVKLALQSEGNILITTFTEQNKEEILNKIKELNNEIIPLNITVQTWFSFLIQHGAKPYQGCLTERDITGMQLVNSPSGLKYINRNNRPVYYSEADVDNHYFTKDYRIYSDKLAKFVVKCNTLNKNAVIDRISSIYSHILVDEVQDLAGYDLEIIKLLFNSDSIIILAGDPRQVTYLTHFSKKNKKYQNGNIKFFIQDVCNKKKEICYIDEKSLKDSWRNSQEICDIANKVFPDFPSSKCLHDKVSEHQGIYLVRNKDINMYLKAYNPVQLRDSLSKQVNSNFAVFNFGASKGKTFDRVLIYPTVDMIKWIKDSSTPLKFQTQCKLYVALTRAIFSVGIVCDETLNISGIKQYNP
ncbi:RecBCD enzyme subunit RecB [Bacillus paralicheniformis]|uniref:UvrD-helicase domain-containing protein n=1 Tax=Bacillus paralicheniformis TaxID=1648923 RepID=A0AAW6KH85_9BACI|nr:UvrD-helicase domain-containing protein [Bacillus paralicheniformis]MDE1454113.1 UvrD-helicase domain-containing protein [Bacillus paralicheniformis]TWM36982.1 RecBCD enzyme subunit RecB [Bacillus paralicheniformis]